MRRSRRPVQPTQSADDRAVPLVDPGTHSVPAASPTLVHSSAASQYLGKRTPVNTIRNNATGIRAFARFVSGTTLPGSFTAEPHLRSAYLDDKIRRSELEVKRLKELLFDGCTPGEPFPVETQKLIRYDLIEFFVNYREQNSGQDASPETMSNYMYAVQRQFEIWGFKFRIGGRLIGEKEEIW